MGEWGVWVLVYVWVGWEKVQNYHNFSLTKGKVFGREKERRKRREG